MIKRRDLYTAVLALALPGFTTWLFFYGMPGATATAWLYSGTKIFMILFPWLYAVRRLPRLRLPTRSALIVGAGFGLVLFVATLLVYFYLRESALFDETVPRLRAKMVEFGADQPLGFAALAIFIAIVNSSLEEYYWRWFLFKRLSDLGIPVAAGLVSSLAFMAHHGVVLSHYLPSAGFWSAATLFTVMTGIGGGIWCFVYHKSGTLWAAWVSHVLVDAAIMLIGADLLFHIF